jgi:hypothetical protein
MARCASYCTYRRGCQATAPLDYEALVEADAMRVKELSTSSDDEVARERSLIKLRSGVRPNDVCKSTETTLQRF